MNTKPKAKKFRVRRSAILPDKGKNPELEEQAKIAKEKLAQDNPASASIPVSELSARQLKMAGRLAERKGLKVTSDEDAVSELRKHGIDPFTRGRLEIVPKKKTRTIPDVPGQDQNQTPVAKSNAPVPVPQAEGKVPGPVDNNALADERSRQIMKMRRDLVKRRRRNLIALGARLFAFVAIPTVLAGYYFSSVASPLYSTHSDFIIQQSESSAAGGVGSLLGGSPLANSQDSITVQRYLTSRGAMLRLEEDVGFREHFMGDGIDVLQRLDPGVSNEDVFKRYLKSVKIGYDPTEGLVKMEVIAPDPVIGLEISKALMGFAEEEVDALNAPIRRAAMDDAEQGLRDAEEALQTAQNRVLSLQEARGVLSAEAEVSALMGQISNFEVLLQEEKLRLQTLNENAQPNKAKVDVSEREIAKLESVIKDLRSDLTEGSDGQASLARISGELIIAESELATRQQMLAQSLQQLETARIEVNRQVRYLLQGVRPTLSDKPSYPKVFENTVLAFAIFLGLYLMISLTISILREQVSS